MNIFRIGELVFIGQRCTHITNLYPRFNFVQFFKKLILMNLLGTTTAYRCWYWSNVLLFLNHRYCILRTRIRTLWKCLPWSGCRWWYWTDFQRRSEEVFETILWNSLHFSFGYTIQSSEITLILLLNAPRK